jgi:hypothetical protein
VVSQVRNAVAVTDKGLSLLTEYRHWRASLPVGAFMLISGYLLIVDAWPELVTHPDAVFATATKPLAWLASRAAVWLLLVGLSMMLGAWWGGVCSWLIALAQRAMLRRLPLQESCSQWTRWQRARLPIRVSEMQRLQNMMRATPDYADLLEVDQRASYRGFLREALSDPYLSIDEPPNDQAELIRAVTDLRLSAGLLPWLPICLAGLAINVSTPAPNGLVWALWTGTLVVTITLVLGVAYRARSASTLAVRLACAPDRLGFHARQAQGAGAAPGGGERR